MRASEFPAILRAEQPPAVVDAALHKRIAGIKSPLRLQVDDEADILPICRRNRVKADVIEDRALIERFVLGIRTPDERAPLIR